VIFFQALPLRRDTVYSIQESGDIGKLLPKRTFGGGACKKITHACCMINDIRQSWVIFSWGRAIVRSLRKNIF